MITLWNIIKKFPGTVAIVIATILGVVILSIMFPERSQLLAMLAVITLVPLVAFRIRKEAGIIVTVMVAIALAFWGPSMVREFNRADNPNGTYASFFAKAKAQTMSALGLYKPGAIGQAATLATVMAADAKLSANLEKHYIQTGSTIDTNQLTLNDAQLEGFIKGAKTIPENQAKFKKILEAAGMTNVNALASKLADTLDTVKVDVGSSSPISIDVPKGNDAVLAVRYARYDCGGGYYGASGCGVTAALSNCSYANAFIAPNLSAWATLYRVNGGEWRVLQDGVTTYVKGDPNDETEIEFVINDRTTTFDKVTPNVGECVIGVQKVPMAYASL